MAWGTGNAVAHRVMDAVMGPRTIKHEAVVSEAAPPASASPVSNSMASSSCDTQSKAFQEVSFENPFAFIGSEHFRLDLFRYCALGDNLSVWALLIVP